MISRLRKFLLIILVLLQFVAPLVHAHSDSKTALNGLHLPEFEVLLIHYDTPSLQLDNYHFDCEHAVVSIGSGIKDKKERLADDMSYDLQAILSIKRLMWLAFEINFSPQPVFVIENPSFNPQSSRAPPFLS